MIGQVVALDCSNPTGARLVARRVYEGVVKPVSECELKNDVTASVLVAADPFSTSDCSTFGMFLSWLIHLTSFNNFYSPEPLKDLLKEIEEKKPSVAILIGPFLDLKNSSVVSSSRGFSQQWRDLATMISDSVKELETKIVLGKNIAAYLSSLC